jgi:hypothetical protein
MLMKEDRFWKKWDPREEQLKDYDFENIDPEDAERVAKVAL